jgi:hypothetical protein
MSDDDDDDDTMELDILRVHTHPDYDGDSAYFDLAILETKKVAFSLESFFLNSNDGCQFILFIKYQKGEKYTKYQQNIQKGVKMYLPNRSKIFKIDI